MPDPADRVRRFRQLHEAGCFVIPNPWDVGSASVLAGLGFPALASTSSGFAWSQGRRDVQSSMEETLAHFRAGYEAGRLRYSELKPALADCMVQVLNPIRARREELVAHPERVREILLAGADRARAVAARTMAEVCDRLGLRGL